jgi:hypothetical protein
MTTNAKGGGTSLEEVMESYQGVDTSPKVGRQREPVVSNVAHSIMRNGLMGVGTSASLKEIMAAHTGVSKATCWRAMVKVEGILARGSEIWIMREIIDKEAVFKAVDMIVEHLIADYPSPSKILTFRANCQLDVDESSLDPEASANLRGIRATDFSMQCDVDFFGRLYNNTAVVLLYSTESVQAFCISVYQDEEEASALQNLYVVRIGPVFVVVVTMLDKKNGLRFPLQWLLNLGEHTSAFVWLAIRRLTWDDHEFTTTTALNLSSRASNYEHEEYGRGNRADQHGDADRNFDQGGSLKSYRLTRLSIAGAHLLNFLGWKAARLSEEKGFSYHVHIPNTVAPVQALLHTAAFLSNFAVSCEVEERRVERRDLPADLAPPLKRPKPCKLQSDAKPSKTPKSAKSFNSSKSSASKSSASKSSATLRAIVVRDAPPPPPPSLQDAPPPPPPPSLPDAPPPPLPKLGEVCYADMEFLDLELPKLEEVGDGDMAFPDLEPPTLEEWDAFDDIQPERGAQDELLPGMEGLPFHMNMSTGEENSGTFMLAPDSVPLEQRLNFVASPTADKKPATPEIKAVSPAVSPISNDLPASPVFDCDSSMLSSGWEPLDQPSLETEEVSAWWW